MSFCVYGKGQVSGKRCNLRSATHWNISQIDTPPPHISAAPTIPPIIYTEKSACDVKYVRYNTPPVRQTAPQPNPQLTKLSNYSINWVTIGRSVAGAQPGFPKGLHVWYAAKTLINLTFGSIQRLVGLARLCPSPHSRYLPYRRSDIATPGAKTIRELIRH